MSAESVFALMVVFGVGIVAIVFITATMAYALKKED